MKTTNTTTNKTFHLCPLKRDTSHGNGLILIADISGFTKFVRETSVHEGSSITQMLLSSIMDSNILNLKVSEIEGDAIFFYKYGELPSVCSILKQYELMLDNFNTKLNAISVEFKKRLELSLKVIVHAGAMTQYSIGKFKKLYGESVIEAHRLLKNPIPSRSYVLLTAELIKMLVDPSADDNCMESNVKMLSQSYGTDKPLEFTYYDYELKGSSSVSFNNHCDHPFHS